MSDWLVFLIVLATLAGVIVVAVRRGWITRPRGHFAGMTVYHDWLKQDAQRGTEIIIQRNAGAQEADDASGDPPRPAPDDCADDPRRTDT
jgi:hypothetical protein